MKKGGSSWKSAHRRLRNAPIDDLVTYTVKYGDTAWDIWKRLGNKISAGWTEFQNHLANLGIDPNKLKVGQKIRLNLLGNTSPLGYAISTNDNKAIIKGIGAWVTDPNSMPQKIISGLAYPEFY